MSGQLELLPVERCDHCGPLEWTKGRYGRVTHKHGCPHRTDPYCQAHPSMCGEPVRPAKNPDWPLTSLPGETFEDIFRDEPPQDRLFICSSDDVDESAGMREGV